MKNNKKLIIIVTIIIIILLILSILLIKYYPKEENKKTNKDQVKDVIENIFFNNKTTIEKLETVTGDPFVKSDIFWGKDSILRTKLSSQKIKKYNLEKYEKIQNEYAPLVEEKFKSSLEYTINEKDSGDVYMTIKTWYFDNYANDLCNLSYELIEMSEIETNVDSEDFEIYEYKGRTIAMKIMNDYLDNYNNQDEIINFRFDFNNGNPEEDEYFTLYNHIEGYTSKYSNSRNEETENSRGERIKKYIEEAISKGIISENNPLNI